MAVGWLGLEIGGIRIDDRDQRVEVKSSKGSWHSSKDGTKLVIPILNFNFSSGNFNYALRHDGGGPYANGIGISYPSTYNWYQSDGFSLLVNGKRYATGVGSNEKSASLNDGKRGDAIFCWDNEVASVQYDFSTHYLDRNLYLIIQIDPHVEITSLALHLNAFPGGFLRNNQQKPLQVLTSGEEFTIAAGKIRELEAQGTDHVFMYRAEELAEDGFRGGCGVIFTAQNPTAIKVTNQFYSQVQLSFPPQTRQIKLALNEMTIPNPADQFRRQYPGAVGRLSNLSFIPLPNE